MYCSNNYNDNILPYFCVHTEIKCLSFRLAKKILNKKNEDKVEMVEDAIDDLTQAHATGSICLQTSEKIVVTTSLSIKHQKKTKLVKTTRVLESLQYTVRETQERRKTQSRLKHECDKEHYRSRLKGEKQNREKPQSEIKIISYKSRAIHQKHQTSKKKNQDYLFIKNRIDTLSKRYSKAKKELRKLLHALKVKTLLIEKRQKQIKQVKDKVKKYRLENHILKEKYKRALLQEELLQEKLNEMQKEIPLPQPFENAQKKGAFIKEVFQNIGMHFRDHSMTVDADIEEQDHVAKERKEQIHIYKKEQAEDEEIIKKLQEKVAESQKETFMFVQTSMEMKRIWKKYQRESELHEYQQRIKREKQYIKDIEDYILKLKHSTSENSGEQTDKNEELWDTTDSHFQHIRHLEEKIEAEFSKNIKLELLYRKLQEEAIALQGLPKDDDNLERRRRGI
ncbi:golgin subfamily A member 6-like protein 22 [Sarcophilus harrisii]|uniref:golgin subfamily A member 6-like protein 22 n=1 Tax=Sarcophilus harrisii TaxID=9305 RepID=UPI001301CF24|nr:golgin subfamily A member 6-like protein 22 [Sarcophilus harrisii]